MEIDRSPDEVFNHACEAARLPGWQMGVLGTHQTPSGPLSKGSKVTKTRKTPLGRQTFADDILECDRVKRLKREAVADGMYRSSGSRWQVRPAGTGAPLAVDVEMRATGLGKLIEPLVVRGAKQQMTRELRTLKELLESNGSRR